MIRCDLKTHPNFKSVDENIRTADAMYNHVGWAIDNQQYFQKTTIPWETGFSINEFPNFKIDLEKVDRLYYIDCDEDEDRYKLICRIQGEFYIYMTANLCSCHSKLKGFIFVGRDANLFMKVVLFRNPQCEETLIYES